ncbi:MAG: hypothetical protein MUO40_01905 [Anaerolineaceae bacterium]|nr:hypothetical protein [Anaerolineaceae bacterium]
MTGTIPAELFGLSNLWYLDLAWNQLTGAIPIEMGSLVNLNYLKLSDNQLSGDVPASFTNLTDLCVTGENDCSSYGLDLGYNRFNVPAPEPPASFLAIKDPDWYLTQAVTQTIPGAIGGTIISNDGNTEALIPPGAVEGDITFTFAPQSSLNNATGSLSFAGNSFALTAEDDLGIPVTTFGIPITLTIDYDDSILGDIAEDTLRLYYWDIGTLAWQDAVTTCTGGVYTRDLDANWLSLPICHLSEFALLMGELPYTTYLPLIIH